MCVCMSTEHICGEMYARLSECVCRNEIEGNIRNISPLLFHPILRAIVAQSNPELLRETHLTIQIAAEIAQLTV